MRYKLSDISYEHWDVKLYNYESEIGGDLAGKKGQNNNENNNELTTDNNANNNELSMQ